METLKIGMVGLDTSHCAHFAGFLHNELSDDYISGGRFINAVAGGSNLTTLSTERIDGFTKTMQLEFGVKVCQTIEEMAIGMDAFVITSVDGRKHLEQFKSLVKFGKPIFIDKPFTCGTNDAKKIIEIAKEENVPVMTTSPLRYAAKLKQLLDKEKNINACEVFGPMPIPEDYPEYFWYGIHLAEMLFLCMGEGCKSVRAIHKDSTDLIIGEWDKGRVGTLRGMRTEGIDFGCTLFADSGIKNYALSHNPPYTKTMLEHILKFFNTGDSSVDLSESLEIISFLEAATKSKEQGSEVIYLT